VLEAAAAAYTKKGYYDQAAHVLRRLEAAEAAAAHTPAAHARHPAAAGGAHGPSKASPYGSMTAATQAARCAELKVLNYYHAGRSADALHTVDAAIRSCSDYNLSARARFYCIYPLLSVHGCLCAGRP